jgi:hypothetical protein
MSDLLDYEKYRGSIEAASKAKRRRMKAFKIFEISAVDRPAQAGARMTLMKRADEGNHNLEDRSPPMARTKQAARDNFCYDDQDFDNLTFETTAPQWSAILPRAISPIWSKCSGAGYDRLRGARESAADGATHRC